ncbi:hypothetical protein [Actinacidiphila glaucinigra]|uniref:hypothetical protein n=1 Tax=Actinacidiphila glaucinigra TaxID=235986 RepID=UPI002E37E709|nr:hypothetical protein [Actinacidiphila glaucinigra]
MAYPALVAERELELAEMLMDQLAGIEITALHDEYPAALEQLVVAKMSGGELEELPEPVPAVDLMEALEPASAPPAISETRDARRKWGPFALGWGVSRRLTCWGRYRREGQAACNGRSTVRGRSTRTRG